MVQFYTTGGVILQSLNRVTSPNETGSQHYTTSIGSGEGAKGLRIFNLALGYPFHIHFLCYSGSRVRSLPLPFYFLPTNLLIGGGAILLPIFLLLGNNSEQTWTYPPRELGPLAGCEHPLLWFCPPKPPPLPFSSTGLTTNKKKKKKEKTNLITLSKTLWPVKECESMNRTREYWNDRTIGTCNQQEGPKSCSSVAERGIQDRSES